MKFPISAYLKSVIGPAILVVSASIIFIIIINIIINQFTDNMLGIIIASLIIPICIVWIIGIDKSEKNLVRNLIYKLFN